MSDLELIELTDSEGELELIVPDELLYAETETQDYEHPLDQLNDNLSELNDNLYYLNENVKHYEPPCSSNKKKKKKRNRKKKEIEDKMKKISNSNYSIKRMVIYSEAREKSDQRLIDFVNFCCQNQLFNDQHLDLDNRFSIFETGLPDTFSQIAGGNYIRKTDFTQYFEQLGFMGDLGFVFKTFDRKKKNKVTWKDFADFFFPFIRKIVVQEQ